MDGSEQLTFMVYKESINKISDSKSNIGIVVAVQTIVFVFICIHFIFLFSFSFFLFVFYTFYLSCLIQSRFIIIQAIYKAIKDGDRTHILINKNDTEKATCQCSRNSTVYQWNRWSWLLILLIVILYVYFLFLCWCQLCIFY